MAKSRLIGDYPVIGIRPTIDGRRGPLKVRESLEVQTMNMAKSAAKLFEENSQDFQLLCETLGEENAENNLRDAIMSIYEET